MLPDSRRSRAVTARGQGGAPRGTNDLDAGPSRPGSWRGEEARGSGQVIGMHPRRLLAEGCASCPGPAVPGAQPYLGARSAVAGSGDMMRDRVPRLGVVAAARSLEADQNGVLAAGSWQEPAASSSVHGRAVGGRAAAGSRGGCHCLLSELTQGVVAAAGEFAGHRQRGQPAVAPVAGRGVVAVVRCGRAGGALGRLIQRPAQQLRSLPGQVPG